MSTDKIPSILLVDDSPADIYLAEHHINAAELCDNLIVRNDGQQALDFLLECREQLENSDDPDFDFPTMILLDINMPRVDGFEFLKKASELGLTNIGGKHITIVVLTTSDFAGDVYRAKQYENVDGYITKPLLEQHAPELRKLHRLALSVSS